MLYRCRLYDPDGTGEAGYGVGIKAGEIVWTNGARKLRVLDVVAVLEEDSRSVGLLMVEPAQMPNAWSVRV